MGIAPSQEMFSRAALAQHARLPSHTIFNNLQNEWEEQCRLLKHTGPQLRAGQAPESECCRLGFCLCSGRGLQASWLQSNLIALLRPVLYKPRRGKRKHPGEAPAAQTPPVRTEARLLLDDARLVFKFEEVRGSAPLAAGLSGWAGVAAALADEQDVASRNGQVVWALLGHMNHSPQMRYMHALLPLQLAAGAKRDEMAALRVPDPVVCHRSLEFYQKLLDLEKKWTVSVYEICTNMEGFNLTGMPPNVLHATRCLLFPANQLFWRGKMEEEAARAAAGQVCTRRTRKA